MYTAVKWLIVFTTNKVTPSETTNTYRIDLCPNYFRDSRVLLEITVRGTTMAARKRVDKTFRAERGRLSVVPAVRASRTGFRNE